MNQHSQNATVDSSLHSMVILDPVSRIPVRIYVDGTEPFQSTWLLPSSSWDKALRTTASPPLTDLHTSRKSLPAKSMANRESQTPQDLVRFLHETTFENLYFLWTLDDAVRPLLTPAHLSAVLQSLGESVREFNGTNSTHLLELCFFCRIAFYHAFYDKTLDFSALAPSVAEQLHAFSVNANFNVFNVDTARIMHEWAHLADASCNWLSVKTTYPAIIATFLDDPQRQCDYDQKIVIYDILTTVFLRGIYTVNPSELLTSTLIDQVQRLVLYTGNNANMRFLAKHGTWGMGHLSSTTCFNRRGLEILTEAMLVHPRSDILFLWSVKAIDHFFDGRDSNGQPVHFEDYRKEIEAKLFPNLFRFQAGQGTLAFRTPLNQETCSRLVDSIMTVRHSFHAITQTTNPVPDDPNENLSVYIYGTRGEYEDFQNMLFGLDSNNGGIYIEQKGTFYTFDRVDSTYSLEELFRHEFGHYLVGRFLVAGMWGATPLYEDGRMVWFDEGIAEFFVGSVPMGVAPRDALIKQIRRDGNSRMRLKQVFAARYGSSFQFYAYAGMLFLYLFQEQIGQLNAVVQYVKASDVAGFDQWTSGKANSEEFENSYQMFLSRFADPD